MMEQLEALKTNSQDGAIARTGSARVTAEKRTEPTYAAAFRCIGAACEDPCCGDWDIPVDRKTYEAYKAFPQEKLGAEVAQFVTIQPAPAADEMYAWIRRGPTGWCPFLGTDRLCGIQKEYGPGLLSSTCSIYPRQLSRVEGVVEGSLSLSCPEAARNVLLDPEFMRLEADLFSGEFRTDNIFRLALTKESVLRPESSYLAIRQLMIDIVRNRAWPLWQRLLLIGSACKDLDSAMAEPGKDTSTLLAGYRGISEGQLFRDELEKMPRQPLLRLQVICELSDARVRDGAGTRFCEVFRALAGCIVPTEERTQEQGLEAFAWAEKEFYRPFMEMHPHVLENFLVNFMFVNLFPYGREGRSAFNAAGMFDEYMRMAMLFAWVNVFAIGMAARHRGTFGGEHVVQVVQSLTRTLEHDPAALKGITEYMKVRGLDNLQGIAIMLRS
jgi:lysine-N-methylase